MTRDSAIPRPALPWMRPAPGEPSVGLLSRIRQLGRERAAVGVILILGVLARIPTLGIALDEYSHPFRQTQTAYLALLFHQNGIDFFHAKLPVLGPPFEVPLEFPLFQALASLVMNAGVAPDLALRLTALAFFFLTAVLLWVFVRQIASATAAFAALILFVFSPFALVWSRAELIEYMATAGALAWLLLGMRWRDRGGRLVWVLALVSGCVAMLVKVTTGAIWILPLLAYRPRAKGGSAPTGSWLRRMTPFAALMGIPFMLAGAWTLYGDQVKSGSELTAWLMSSRLTTWNFGTLAQRLDGSTWFDILTRAGTEFGGPLAALFVVGLVICFRARAQRRLWLAIAATATLPILIFTNLYLIHDYYLAAVSPGIAMIQGLLVAYLLAPLTKPLVRRIALVTAVLLFAFSMAVSRVFWGYVYEVQGDPSGTLAEAAELAANSAPTDMALTEGREWSPEILYLSRRQGLALPGWVALDGRADLIDPHVYRAASFLDPKTGHLELLAAWPVVEVLAKQTYALRTSASDLGAPHLLAADSSVLPIPATATVVSSVQIVIPCDGQAHAVPAGATGTWLELAPAGASARLVMSDAYAAVPARGLVLMDPSLTPAGSAAISCLGAASVTVQQILDAPLPAS